MARQNKIEFKIKDLFTKSVLENEIFKKYPSHYSDIITFKNQIILSIKVAVTLIILLIAIALILFVMR